MRAALVKIGTIFSVELDSIQEPWMLAKATSELYKYDGASKETWMGRIDPGDMIINVAKLEPTAAGASSFTAMLSGCKSLMLCGRGTTAAPRPRLRGGPRDRGPQAGAEMCTVDPRACAPWRAGPPAQQAAALSG